MKRSRPEVAAPLIDFAGLYREYALEASAGPRPAASLGRGDGRRRADPEHRMAGLSDWQAVLAALATLPDIDRAALLMRADEALPYEEIRNWPAR